MPFEVQYLTPLLQVFDMPASVRFYRDKLGFEVVANSDELAADKFHWVWLRRGKANLMLNTAFEFDHERPREREAAWVATHGDTGLFLGCPDVDAAYEELLARGLEVKKPLVTGYGMKQLYLRDPDGYTICFQWDAPQ